MILEADAILFDSDGVLVDSHGETLQAWRQLATEFELDIDALVGELVGVRAADTLGRHLAGERLATAVDRLEHLEVELADRTRPLAGAVDLLGALPTGRWTIVTSASRRLATARWRGAGLPAPAVTVTAEDVHRGKPDPEPFLAGARLLGVDPQRCLVFEDSPSGGVAARAAGAQVVAVGAQPWPHEPAVRVADLTGITVGDRAAAPPIEVHLDPSRSPHPLPSAVHGEHGSDA